MDARVLSQVVDARGRHHFWQRGVGYDRNIYSEQELIEKIEYIHNNPVRCELVPGSTDRRWSSVQAYEKDAARDALIDMPPV